MTSTSTGDGEEYVPTDEEAAEIEAGLDEIERGEYVTLAEFMREVHAIRTDEERKSAHRESRPSP